MDGNYLTPEQRKKLRGALVDHEQYFAALRKRMQAKCWYTCDGFYTTIVAIEMMIRAAVTALPDNNAPVHIWPAAGPQPDITMARQLVISSRMPDPVTPQAR